MPIYDLIEKAHSLTPILIAVVDTESEVDFQGMKAWTIQNLATRQREIQDQLDTIKTISTRLQKEFDTIRLNVLPEKMDEEDITNITVTGVGRVVVQSDIYFSIPADSKEDAYEWLKANGHSDLVQETVNSSSGKAWAKEMYKKGQSLPENLFKVTPFSRAQITKVK